MMTPKEYLYSQLIRDIEEAGGFVSEYTEALLDQVVETVWEDPRNDTEEEDERCTDSK